MRTTTNSGSLWALLAITSLAIAVPSCGDDEDDDGGGNRGGSSGKGGSSGASGASGKGGTAGQGGSTGGTPGQGGAAGKGGTAGQGGTTGGTSGAGGQGGDEGGMGGEGGMPPEPVTLYDFETATQVGATGWNTFTTGASASQSTDQHVDGANSLKITHAAIDATNVTVEVQNPNVWPGTVLTLHAFLPAGLDTTGGAYYQAFSQGDNYADFDTVGNSARTTTPGAWNTWTYTVPDFFPGGIQKLGFQLGDNAAGATIAAGDFYIDAITATGGTEGCARATPSVTHDFETAWAALPAAQAYQVADGSDAVTGPNITIARSTMRFFDTGTASLGVAFTALPPPAGTETGKRIVFINAPNVYCGQAMTFHVFLPTGSDGLNFQVFAQYNNYAPTGFSGTGPQAAVTRDGWNTATFTIPMTVGPGGIQRVGIEFIYTGTVPYTGDVYIDQVTW